MFFIVTTFLPGILFSQDGYYTKSKKAVKLFEEAYRNYNSRNNDQALKELDQALKIDSNFIDAYLLKANIFEEKKDIDKVLECYRTVIRIDPEYSPRTYFNLADIELGNGRYPDAKEHFQAFIDIESKYKKLKETAAEGIVRCEFGIYAMAHPVPFNPINLGDKVNTKYDDYWPSLTADEYMLVTTVELPINPDYKGPLPNRQEDFFVSYKVDGEWTQVRNVGEPLNTPKNEGAQCLSVGGQYMFFTACNREDGLGSCDIYFSVRINNIWTIPKNLGKPVNSEYWETQPSFSSDGRTLYYVSNRRGGWGRMDIWKSTFLGLDHDGNLIWSEPENLGDSINTLDDEMSPFIHPDNKTLYFASKGHIGMGGFDLFMSRKIDDTTWVTPENLGYPINTYHDEIGLIVNAKGKLAMFSSDRLKGQGKDIYEFDLYEKVRPDMVTYVKGTVYDAVTKEKLQARFELIELEKAKTVVEAYSGEKDGQYLVCLPINKNYAFNASREGYLFFSENFSLKNLTDPSKPYILDIPLQPIAVNKTVELKNIFYETDKYDLKPESKAELSILIKFMQTNPGVKIEISGHTDNVGTKEYNQTLSENRAGTVYRYLIDNGIPEERLSYKGYGLTQPKYSNETEEGRAKNRRTEFKVTGI